MLLASSASGAWRPRGSIVDGRLALIKIPRAFLGLNLTARWRISNRTSYSQTKYLVCIAQSTRAGIQRRTRRHYIIYQQNA